MKRFLLLLAIVIAYAVPLLAQETNPPKKPAPSIKDVILKLEQDWEDALLKSDVTVLERLYADTMIYTHSSGSVDDKKRYLENIRSGNTKYESMKRDEINVRVYGNTALVTCHWQVNVMSAGNKVNTNARYLHVYVRQNNRWQLVAHQATRLVSSE